MIKMYKEIIKEWLKPHNIIYKESCDKKLYLLDIPPHLQEELSNYCTKNGLVFCQERKIYQEYKKYPPTKPQDLGEFVWKSGPTNYYITKKRED